MTNREQLHELRQAFKAIEAAEAALAKYEGVGALKADQNYIAQRKILLKGEITRLQDKLAEERIAELNQITTIEQAIQLLNGERHLPLRILLRITENGQYEGEVEHSFSLSWERDRVGIYWSGTAYNLLGTSQLDAIKNAEGNAARKDNPSLIIVCDPLSTECPVEVDIVTWVKAFMSPRAKKFDKRNAPMKQKEHYERRALQG